VQSEVEDNLLEDMLADSARFVASTKARTAFYRLSLSLHHSLYLSGATMHWFRQAYV
jgi:hypothetical protein